ncbi:MAG: hypothetical protein U1D96_02345 [Eubacteriales bacterium]|jgi:hypothetical protein|nr:hypothetical protein [Bacillota bacterium]MBV1727074.1 hypothetical protein [Desulforudis sp.]MDP3050978.1 hypothetical protein [Eubacteriales bacterium]MDQ7789397.1 hypothetical protein [Clostridia bacterium]MBU4533128.1 hypothetical protein [Bacillota bacterium]
MRIRKIRLAGVLVALSVVLLAAGAYSVSNGTLPFKLYSEVAAGTGMVERVAYPCGVFETIYMGPVPSELEGLDLQTIGERYRAEEGWAVSYDVASGLVLTRNSDELCPKHAAYRHLGIHDGLVAVFEGPLGHNEKVLWIEQIRVKNLGHAYLQRLEQAMEFESQSAEIQAELRTELEFPNEDALHAALENLDELKE